MKRPDLGREAFVSFATRRAYVDAYGRQRAGSLDERALYGMRSAAAEAGHGGAGFGAVTLRVADRQWDAWVADVAQRLEAHIASYGEGSQVMP